MLLKKLVLPLAFVLVASLPLMAQETEGEEKEEKPKGFQKENLFIGGNFGLSFGDYTYINISPQLGYRFNNYLAAGFGINGVYTRERVRDFIGNTYSKHNHGIIGLNVFGRVYPFKFLMIQAQPEMNYRFGKDTYYGGNAPGTYNSGAEIIPSLLLGAGAVLSQGRGALIISAMYDVLERKYSPYGRKPIYNIGYNVGLY